MGGNYGQNGNYGLFYVNYNGTSNTNGNIGCRFLIWNGYPSSTTHESAWAQLTAHHLAEMSRQDAV